MSPKFWLALAFLVFATAACKCGGPPLKPTDDLCKGLSGVQVDHESSCAENNECADHFSCTTSKDKEGVRCCLFADRKCASEADCCPGQTCPMDRKKCFDKYLSCDTDADCGENGDRVCLPYSDIYGNSNRCRFKPCVGAVGMCPDGQSCFQGECLATLPCGGSCDPGKGCVIDTDRCQDYSKPTGRDEAACPMTCNAGFIATFKDPKNIFDTCNLPAVACVCAELPGLQSEDLGRFSAIAGESGKGLSISEYDGQYGDLVVARYDLNGTRLGLDYLDGVPSGSVKYGGSGARGGVIEPGDDVGRYTDIATGAAGQMYVSYFDVTHGDLKVAVRNSEGKWTNHKVDGDTAEVGLYTSIAVDSDGLPGVSYFQRGAESTFDVSQCPAPQPTGPKLFITALKYAHATTATPTSASDWTVSILACQSRPTPPCYSCVASDTCADPGTGPDCYSPATTCTGCDPNTEACVTVGAAAKCGKKYNPSNLNDITDGVGLFSSIAFNGKEAYVGFMKRTTPPAMGATRFNPDGDLYAIKISSSGTAGPLVKIDSDGDTGYFPDVKIDPSTKNIAIGYHDFSSKKLKFYFASQLQTGVIPEVIDNGAGAAGSGESNWVGTDSSLIFGGSAGQIYAVYQDATKGDLKLAKRSTSWQLLPPIHTAGAVGFFADGLFIDGKMFASHAKIHARLFAGAPHVDNTLLVEPVPGN
jgi:hypothetical protein